MSIFTPEVDLIVISCRRLFQSSGLFAVNGSQNEKQCTFRVAKLVKSICDTSNDEHDPLIDRCSVGAKEGEGGDPQRMPCAALQPSQSDASVIPVGLALSDKISSIVYTERERQ